LRYRQDYEFAVGHNVSVIANPTQSCTEVKTAWMPTAEVEKVIANEAIPVELSMEAIANRFNADFQSLIGIVHFLEYCGSPSK
jgi:hypothetical protein